MLPIEFFPMIRLGYKFYFYERSNHEEFSRSENITRT